MILNEALLLEGFLEVLQLGPEAVFRVGRWRLTRVPSPRPRPGRRSTRRSTRRSARRSTRRSTRSPPTRPLPIVSCAVVEESCCATSEASRKEVGVYDVRKGGGVG